MDNPNEDCLISPFVSPSLLLISDVSRISVVTQLHFTSDVRVAEFSDKILKHFHDIIIHLFSNFSGTVQTFHSVFIPATVEKIVIYLFV